MARAVSPKCCRIPLPDCVELSVAHQKCVSGILISCAAGPETNYVSIIWVFGSVCVPSRSLRERERETDCFGECHAKFEIFRIFLARGCQLHLRTISPHKHNLRTPKAVSKDMQGDSRKASAVGKKGLPTRRVFRECQKQRIGRPHLLNLGRFGMPDDSSQNSQVWHWG